MANPQAVVNLLLALAPLNRAMRTSNGDACTIRTEEARKIMSAAEVVDLSAAYFKDDGATDYLG